LRRRGLSRWRGTMYLSLNAPIRSGFETASRNSEVIHGGLYYPAGSLKARCCVAGRERLYPYCRDHGVPHVQIGKPIVAAEESEIAGLERVANTARANGVDDLQWLTARQAQRLEPALRCVAALLSPSTGIIDSHALMLAFQGEAEAAGAMVVLRASVLSGRVRDDGFDLAIGGTSRPPSAVAASSMQLGSMRPPRNTPLASRPRRSGRIGCSPTRPAVSLDRRSRLRWGRFAAGFIDADRRPERGENP